MPHIFLISDAKNKLVYLYFDRILQEATNEEKFNAIRDRLDVFINAGNICILNHGVTGENLFFN